MDVIFKLCEKKFSKLNYQEQLTLKEQGRRTPDLNIEIAGIAVAEKLIRDDFRKISI